MPKPRPKETSVLASLLESPGDAPEGDRAMEEDDAQLKKQLSAFGFHFRLMTMDDKSLAESRKLTLFVFCFTFLCSLD